MCIFSFWQVFIIKGYSTMKTLIILLAVYFVFDVAYTINNIIQMKKLKKLLKKFETDLSD